MYTTINDTLNNFLKMSSKIMPIEYIKLLDAKDRVLAEDLKSNIDLPPFDRSAMDGYAILAEDTNNASKDNPAILNVIGRVYAGELSSLTLKRGEAVAIATGAPMPNNANAVVMIEDTRLVDNKVQIFKKIERGKHIARKGEDIKKGQLIVKKGSWLTPFDIGILASTGLKEVPVRKKIDIAIFATGSELLEPGTTANKNKIYESNRYMISSLTSSYSCNVIDLGIVEDDQKTIEVALTKALNYDIVVISGGSSVGEKDFVPKIIDNLGEPGIIVHKVAMKPGSPTALGMIEQTPIIALPGYPISALAAFYAFGMPLIYRMLSALPKDIKIKGKITKNIKLHKDMSTFLRVKVYSDGRCEPISAKGASLLSTLINANGILIVDKEELKEGDEIDVIIIKSIW